METEKIHSNPNGRIYVKSSTGEEFAFFNGEFIPAGNSAPAAQDVMSATTVDDALNAEPFPRDFAVDDKPIINQVAPEMVAPNPGGSTEGALESNALRPGRSTGGRSGRANNQANANGRIYVDPDGVEFRFVNGRFVPELSLPPIVSEAGMTILDNLSNLVENVPNSFIDFANDTKNFGLVPALAVRAPFTGVPRDDFRGALSEAEPAIPNIPQFFDVPGAEDIVGFGQEVFDEGRELATGEPAEDITIPERAQRVSATRLAARENYPQATTFGGVLGDAASIGLTRNVSGVSRKMVKKRNLEALTAQQRANQALLNSNLAGAPADTYRLMTEGGKLGYMRDAFSGLKNSSTPFLSKMAEAGAEGYVLGLMRDQNPLEVAAFGAAVQGGSSAILQIADAPIRYMGERITGNRGFTGWAAGLAASSFIASSLIQVAKELPYVSEKEYILESLESGYEKTLAAVIAGGLASKLGGSRPTGDFSANFPGFADFINSVPRAGVTAALAESQKDPVAVRVINQVSIDPYFFGEYAGRKLDRALRDESISVAETIEDLRDTNENFRDNLRLMNDRFDAMEQPGMSTGGRSGRVNDPVQSAPGLLVPQANNLLDAQG